MRKLKTLWRSARSPRVWEELETWIGVLLFLGAAWLLFVTLKTQAAYGRPSAPVEATHVELTMAAGAPLRGLRSGARGTPWQEAYVRAVLAPGMPPHAGPQREAV